MKLTGAFIYTDCHCYENRLSSVRPEPVEGLFMVRQAHHERPSILIFIHRGADVNWHE